MRAFRPCPFLPSWRRAAALPALAGALTLGAAGDGWAQAAKNELPIPESPQDDLTAIQQMFKPAPPPPLALFPQLNEGLRDLPPVLRDSRFDLQLRSYYRDQVRSQATGATVQEAWATGGAVSFETGPILDVVSGGMTLYTSQPLYAPEGYGNTGLLLPDQSGYTVVGQLYGQVRLGTAARFTAGRYLYDTPYLGPNDSRMTPNTFYGYSVIGTVGGDSPGAPSLRYGVGYIATMKLRDSAVFQSMSRVAGAKADNGVGAIAGLLSWGPASIGAIEYYCQDTLNIAYAEGKYGVALPAAASAILALQVADQRSTGAALTNGGVPFTTSQWAARLELGRRGAILGVAYSVVAAGYAMQNPWSANPVYTSAMVQSFQRAGEQALMVGGSYVFDPVGLEGLAASVYFYRGWTGAAGGPPTVENEWDFTLEWRPRFKPLSGLWLQARYAHVAIGQGSGLTTIDEGRAILNYRVQMY